jgi:hypothetical protein
MRGTMREQKQVEFFEKYNHLIIEEYLKNENNIGYVQIFADNEFELIPPVKFIKGDFDTKSFVKLEDILYKSKNLKTISELQESQKGLNKIIDSAFMYCEILWFDNKTKWQIKGLMLDGL